MNTSTEQPQSSSGGLLVEVGARAKRSELMTTPLPVEAERLRRWLRGESPSDIYEVGAIMARDLLRSDIAALLSTLEAQREALERAEDLRASMAAGLDLLARAAALGDPANELRLRIADLIVDAAKLRTALNSESRS